MIEVEQLDPSRKTLHRLTLEPIIDFPRTIIVKQQKEGWEKEFQSEIQTYEKLKLLQGKVIPQYFGQRLFNEAPALFLSEVPGTTLHDIAHDNEWNIEQTLLESQLKKSLMALSEQGAVFWDAKLDNFMFCYHEGCEDGKVMIVDLEDVKFSDKTWEIALNLGSVSSLMSDFRDIRDPNRSSSPVDWSVVGMGQAAEK